MVATFSKGSRIFSRAFFEYEIMWLVFKNADKDNPEKNLAVPNVGRTWLGPAT